MDRLWRQLRQPFALCTKMQEYHKCEFELFDIDAAGCVICGKIHRCSPQTCKEVVHTDDSVVCLVTGFCVESKIFAETEYSDTIASYNMNQQAEPQSGLSLQYSDIELLMQQLLVSDKARSSHDHELQRFRLKLQANMAQEINRVSKKGVVNVVDVIQQSLCLTKCNRILSPDFDLSLRTQLVQTCSQYICYVINTCVNMFHMCCKPSELRMIVFGLVYLMRNGVVMQNIQVIPKLSRLQDILPSENSLLHAYNFRAKYITDVENKFKFLFRSLKLQQLLVFVLRFDDMNGQHSSKQ